MKRIYNDTFFTHSQVRIGKNKKPIIIRKIRTMKRNSHLEYHKKRNGLEEIKNDARTTRLGKILRRTKRDELPQIISWLKGDLNLIGLRPVTRQNFQEFPLKYKTRYSEIGPGLFGIQYSIPKNQRNIENISKLFDEFYSDFKSNKRKAYLKWGKRILRNIWR